MTLLNLTVLGAHRPHIPWIDSRSSAGLTFSALFSKITAGTHPALLTKLSIKARQGFCWPHKGFVKHRGRVAHH